MKARLNSYLISAGFTSISLSQFIASTVITFALLWLIIYEITSNIWISFSVLACVLGQGLEQVRSRADLRLESQNIEWPRFIDAIHSCAWGGTSVLDSIIESARFAPKAISNSLLELEKDQNSGLPSDVCLDNWKARCANPIADRFIEITRLSIHSGGRGYLLALRDQSEQLRLENATWQEIKVKQNWVMSTAKLALLAPWLVLVVLGSRRETTLAFETETGLLILAFGLTASLVAFKLIKVLARLPQRKRTLL